MRKESLCCGRRGTPTRGVDRSESSTPRPPQASPCPSPHKPRPLATVRALVELTFTYQSRPYAWICPSQASSSCWPFVDYRKQSPPPPSPTRLGLASPLRSWNPRDPARRTRPRPPQSESGGAPPSPPLVPLSPRLLRAYRRSPPLPPALSPPPQHSTAARIQDPTSAALRAGGEAPRSRSDCSPLSRRTSRSQVRREERSGRALARRLQQEVDQHGLYPPS